MMRPIILLAVFVSSILAASAQTPKASPPPQPRSTPATTSTPQRAPATVRTAPAIQTDVRRLETMFPLNTISESDRLSSRVVYLQQAVAPLYRKPSGKELEAIAPDSQFALKYGQFLKLPDTGIFRLVPDSGCAPNSKVVNAREDCLKYSMPGAGNSYSFRTENYRIRHLADITYNNGSLHVTGIFMHGMLARLGDVPLESTTLNSPGMKFITDFKPSTSFSEVVQIDASFKKGIEVAGYKYAMSAPVESGVTYAFRGVAYRGRVVRVASGIRYNELDFDKREDVTVVFRVIEKADDGSITIIWRQLAERESPKIKMPNKNETDDDSVSAGN
jgi:hypothetical protein